MDVFIPIIQGGYAYLLILLILIVSALFLTLLWLVVKRTKEASVPEAIENATITPTTVTIVDNSALEAEKKRALDLASQNEKLQNQIEDLQSQISTSQPDGQSSKSLNEKIQFLESKLLEYEILQEEISALSALKIENEQLKQQLVQSGKSIGDTGVPPIVPEMVVRIPAPNDTTTLNSDPQPDNIDHLLAEIDKLTGPSETDSK